MHIILTLLIPRLMSRSLSDAILQGEFKKVTECKIFSFQQVVNIKVTEFFNIKF